MRTRLCVTMIVAAIATALAREQSPPQSFRATTDTVSVDVSVRRGGTMLTGLSATDFVVTDNGVNQRVETVEATSVPIDVTLIVDVSGDFHGTWLDHSTPMERVTSMLDEEVAKVTALLRPDDRIRLLAIDTYTNEVFPMQAAGTVRPIRHVTSGGMGAVFDTLLGAALQPVEPNRRHVVIARTKGIDTISAIEAATLRDVVRRSDVLMHIVMMERASDDQDVMRDFQCEKMGLCSPTRKFWTPFERVSMGPALGHLLTGTGKLLAESAEATGGVLHQTEALTEPTLTGTFKQAFEDFRASYVLRYSPAGVKREGWHAIGVSVPTQPKADLKWRRGYAIDEPATKVVDAPVVLVETLPQMIQAYGRGDYVRVSAALRRSVDPANVMRDFLAGGNPWPAAPRREAALALELAAAGLQSGRADASDGARDLLQTFTRFVRHPIEPDRFERHWLWAKLAMFEAMLQPVAASDVVEEALERFPAEPRFVLARAIVADQFWMPATTAGLDEGAAAAPTTDQHVADVIERYEAAGRYQETAFESRVRLGWFLHRLGRDVEALSHLDQNDDQAPTDDDVRYLRQLFRGRVLLSLNRIDEAVSAFRSAQTLVPAASSARAALAAALVRAGRSADTGAAGGAMPVSAAVDPLVRYWQGDVRMFDTILTRVREMIQ